MKSAKSLKRPANKDYIGCSPRTQVSVINDLSKNMSKLDIDNYMSCRLSAMAPKSVRSIPDGKSGKHVNTCFWRMNNLTLTGATNAITMQLVPALPSPLWITGPSTVLVDNLAVSTGLGGSQYQATPIGNSTQLVSSGAKSTIPGKGAVNPFNAGSLRFSSVGLRIRYTGPAATCAGIIQVYKSNIQLTNPKVTTNTDPAGGVALPTTGVFMPCEADDSAYSCIVPTGTTLYEMNMSDPELASPLCGVQMFRPEQGVVVRLNHDGEDYKKIPWSDNYFGIAQVPAFGANYDNETNYLTTGINAANFATDRVQGGLFAFDNDWESVVIKILNPNSDASYMLETCVCCEVTPQQDSIVLPLALEGSKASPELKTTEKILKVQGPAIPMNMGTGMKG